MSSHTHSHHDEATSDTALLWAIVVNLGLSLFEFIAGIISGSVALMADALHNTNDAFALIIAYIARRISGKSPDSKYTFGYRRAELIGAMIQFTSLIIVGLYLLYEAIARLFSPEPLLGIWIMAASGIAIVVDVATVVFLWAMSRGSLNVKAAFLHNLTDAAASVAVLLGGAAVYWLHWIWVDPLLTILISGYILYMSIRLLKSTCRILMEGSPPDINCEKLKFSMEAITGVKDIHHLHVWELDEHKRALEAHVVVDAQAMNEAGIIKQRIKDLLKDRFLIEHSCLELEVAEESCAPCD